MTENKEELQLQVSQLIHQDIVNIISDYSEKNILSLDLVRTFIQDITLLKAYEVEYIHNQELDEVIGLIYEEFQDKVNTAILSLLIGLDFLLGKEEDLKKALFINLFLKTPKENFIEAFSIFEILSQSILELYENMMKYIYNDKFLSLDDETQIDIIFKTWYNCFNLYHDNEASIYAYNHLKNLFHKALDNKKTEVAFWLYYFPLNYYNNGTDSNIDVVNRNFKIEIENPLEKYIKNYIIPTYNIKPYIKPKEINEKKKVAFIYPRIKNHSTVNVLFYLLKGLMESKQEEYEFIVYDLFTAELGGSELESVNELKSLGIKYINLHTEVFNELDYTYPLLEKCLKIREFLLAEKIDIFIGLHTRVEYMFLYLTRIAPVQIYWFHNSNSIYDVKGIDKRISHASKPENCKYEMQTFDVLNDYRLKKHEDFDEEVNTIKGHFNNKFVLGTIGRLIKIDNDEFISIISTVIKKYENVVFLACGAGDILSVKEKLEKFGIDEKRFIFTGHIEPQIYAHVLDVFVNTFPIIQGESRTEVMNYTGLPILSMNTEEIFAQDCENSFHEDMFLEKTFDEINQLDIEAKANLLFHRHIKKESFFKAIDFLIKNRDFLDEIQGYNLKKINHAKKINHTNTNFIEKVLD